MVCQLGGKRKRVITLPDWLVRIGAGFLAGIHALRGLENGLEPFAFINLQTRKTFIDSTQVRSELGYEDEDLTQALRETIKACNY